MSHNSPKPPPDEDAAPEPTPRSEEKPTITRELLIKMGFKVPEPRGEGFMIVPIGRPIRSKPSPK